MDDDRGPGCFPVFRFGGGPFVLGLWAATNGPCKLFLSGLGGGYWGFGITVVEKRFAGFPLGLTGHGLFFALRDDAGKKRRHDEGWKRVWGGSEPSCLSLPFLGNFPLLSSGNCSVPFNRVLRIRLLIGPFFPWFLCSFQAFPALTGFVGSVSLAYIKRESRLHLKSENPTFRIFRFDLTRGIHSFPLLCSRMGQSYVQW